jgi:hypothetical protein
MAETVGIDVANRTYTAHSAILTQGGMGAAKRVLLFTEFVSFRLSAYASRLAGPSAGD